MRAFVLALTFAVILAAFYAVVRPWYVHWGATEAEARMTLPGDEIAPVAITQTTRAITIDASADTVWPWVAQIGQDRGGFYSFDLLENLVGCRMPTTDMLRPDKQTWNVGDKLWMYPPDRGGGSGFATLRTYVPGRALAFAGRRMGDPVTAPESGSWAFVLQPLDAHTTRLLFRGRASAPPSLGALAFDRFIFDPAHYVMERRTMIGVKQLAEGGSRHRWANHAQVLLWTITFIGFVMSGIGVLRRRQWQRPLAAFIASALVFQFLTLGQPPVWIGVAVVAILASFGCRAPAQGNFPRAARSSAPAGVRAA
jgi:hypothetical protein